MQGNHRPIRRAIARLAVIGMLALAACSTPGAGAERSSAADASAPATNPALECVEHGYPCSMAEVPQEIIERTMELGGQASERMTAGESAQEVVAWLRQDEQVAEAAAQDSTLRYRLTGGRPAWVADNPNETEPDPAAEQPVDAMLAMNWAVAGNDETAKRAIVLSPFKWELGDGDYGSRVADLLRGTRGYAAGVTYLENATKTATTVTVDSFTRLAGNALIYIQSESAKVCTDGSQGEANEPTPLDGPCWSVILAQEVPPAYRIDNPHVGVDLFMFNGGDWSLGLSGDFFSAEYGDGIEGAIIVLNVPDVQDEGLMEYLQGPTSDFLGWEGLRPTEEGGAVTLRFLQRLAESGRTVDSVYNEMRPELRAGDAELFAFHQDSGGSNRLREVVQLRDRSSGEPLDEVGTVSVSTKLGDGEPDHVPFMVDVEGLTPEEAASTTINLLYGNYQMDPLLAADGEQIGESTWRHEGLAEVPDLADGESLEVRAFVQLPEGGLSRDDADVKVGGLKRPEIGTKWAGTISSTLGSWFPGVTITRTAEVEFTRDPAAAADAEQVYFYVSGGSLTWEMKGTSEGCSYNGYAAGVPLDADEYVYLLFDVSGESIRYSANANNDDGPTVDVAVSCDTHDYTYGTGAKALWWYLPPGAGFELTGDTMSGEWSDGTKYPTTWTWELHRVED